MNVGELKKALKGYKDSCEVYLVRDWETIGEYNELTELSKLRGITDQIVVVDMGLDFEDITQVLLDVED